MLTELEKQQDEVARGPTTDHLGDPKDEHSIRAASCPCNGFVGK